MKKYQKAQFQFKKAENKLKELKLRTDKTPDGKLWHDESVIRNNLRILKTLSHYDLKGFDRVENGYVVLLNSVSSRLLKFYNMKNKTSYNFEEIIDGREKAYLESGIISVLVTSHIPKIVSMEFERLLPENPKDEFPDTRSLKRKFYLHLGDTNTGKTYNALERLKNCKNGIYLSPLRILALENYEKLNNEGVLCSLVTGEEEILIDGATHTSSTVEKANLNRYYDVAVIDEIQMIADHQRGDAWTRAVLGLKCSEIHLCGALNSRELLIKMIKDCEDDFEVKEYKRLVPLKCQHEEMLLPHVKKGDALVAFSKKKVLSLWRYYFDLGINCSIIYGDLPPEVRKIQYEAFTSGRNSILVTTDAVGMGVNLPIRRIIFTEIQKFDGEEMRLLTSQEIKQIAGRAGRIGIYEVGYVASTKNDIEFIEDMIATEDDPLEKMKVGPTEILLQVKGIPLKEKLALWSTKEENLPYYGKKDISDYILLLEKIECYRLPENVQWALMKLPFDMFNDELMEQFIMFVEECFVLKKDKLSKPVVRTHSLSGYEAFYRKVNLYYSFSKNMNLEFDEQWVYNTRINIGNKINDLL